MSEGISDGLWRRRWMIVAAAFAAWFVAAGTYFIWFRDRGTGGPEEWGQFGDYLGGVLNPLVGSLTLAGLVVTVALQRDLLAQGREQLKQAKIQALDEATNQAEQQRLLREQVEDTKREAIRAETEARAQLALMRRQTFESMFAQLLSAVSKQLDEVFLGQAKGQLALAGLLKELGDWIFTNVPAYVPHNLVAQQWVKKFFVLYEPNVGPYLRSLSSLHYFLELTEESVAGMEKLGAGPWPGVHFYGHLALDLQSRYALKLYVCFAEFGNDVSAKGFLENYQILERIPNDDPNWWGWRLFQRPTTA